MDPLGKIPPVRELCALARDKGVLTSVDAAHPLGMADITLREMGCDLHAGTGQKWLLAGTGTGVSYVRADLEDQIRPDCSIPGNEDGDCPKGARICHLSGQWNAPSSLALGVPMTIGTLNIESRIHPLNEPLREQFSKILHLTVYPSKGSPPLGVLTTFKVGDVPAEDIVSRVMDLEQTFIRTGRSPALWPYAPAATSKSRTCPAKSDGLLRAIHHIATHQADDCDHQPIVTPDPRCFLCDGCKSGLNSSRLHCCVVGKRLPRFGPRGQPTGRAYTGRHHHADSKTGR